MKHAIRHSTHRRSQAHSVTIKRNQAYEPILHLLRRVEVDPKRRHLGAHRPFEFRPWQVLHREHALRAEMMVSHLMRYVLGCQFAQQSEAIERNRAQSEAIRRNQTQSDAIMRNQAQSGAIGRNRAQSDAIRRNRTQSPAPRRDPHSAA